MFNQNDIKPLVWEDLDGMKCTLKRFKDKDNGELLVAITEDKKLYILNENVGFEEKRYSF